MKTESQESLTIHGDKPNADNAPELDALADQVSATILDQASDDGLVIGIEGEWGSGKSTLLEKIRKRLTDRAANQFAPTIVEFAPWIVGHRDAMLAEFFRNMMASIERQRHHEMCWLWKQFSGIGSVTRALHEYARHIPGPLIGAGSELALPGTQLIAVTTASAISFAAEKLSKHKSLSDAKNDVKRAMRTLKARIVVLIDDLDRLEPAEALEVLRLLKAIADFPNVVYVACYDPVVLKRDVELAAQVSDGQAYLEKFFQVSFAIPRPEDLALREWFAVELQKFADVNGEMSPEERRSAQSRLASIIDLEGSRYLKVPRDVIRAINAIKARWPSLHGKVDLADLVWLQLLRLKNKPLYNWIEAYMTSYSATRLGPAIASPEEEAQLISTLNEILPLDPRDRDRARYDLQDRLPGIGRDILNKAEDFTIFQSAPVSPEAIAQKRLSSPDHSRLYFSLDQAKSALSQENYEEFVRYVNASQSDCVRILQALQSQPKIGYGPLWRCLDRLAGTNVERLTVDGCSNLVMAMSGNLDRSYQVRSFQMTIWEKANDVLKKALSKMPRERRTRVVEDAFRTGSALGWMIDVFRKETGSHGYYGDRSKPVGERIFTSEEFEVVRKTMLNRIAVADDQCKESVPELYNLLYAWSQGGGTNEAKAWLEKATQHDASFIRILYRLVIDEAVLSGANNPAQVDQRLASFSDPVAVRSRCALLADHHIHPEIQYKARELLGRLNPSW